MIPSMPVPPRDPVHVHEHQFVVEYEGTLIASFYTRVCAELYADMEQYLLRDAVTVLDRNEYEYQRARRDFLRIERLLIATQERFLQRMERKYG